MRFISTRNGKINRTLSEAILDGLAADGGLFVPEVFPQYEISDFNNLDLNEMASRFLQPFFEGDHLSHKLNTIIARTFQFPIPLNFVEERHAILELFHGPTGAFKDIGARFLAQCFGQLQQQRTILVATSGDTGSAVASAFHGIDNIDVKVLYPRDKISYFQEQQLTFWDDNITAIKVNGDFDSCQHLVKSAFTDLSSNYQLSSANSINIGRLLPQCVYYVASSIWYLQQMGTEADFIIPTGNMGNALAAIWVKHMGFPINRIYLACNTNDTIPTYFDTGTFTPQPSQQTLANAMDVGNPSNMERFLHLVNQKPDISKQLDALSVTDTAISETIKRVSETWNMLICPHTATAIHLLYHHNLKHTVIVATAHPYKFNEIITNIVNQDIPIPDNLRPFIAVKPQAPQIEPTLDNLQEKLNE